MVKGVVSNRADQKWYRVENKEDLISVGILSIANEISRGNDSTYNGTGKLYTFFSLVAKFGINNYLRKKDQKTLYQSSFEDEITDEDTPSQFDPIEDFIERDSLYQSIRDTEAFLAYPIIGEWFLSILPHGYTIKTLKQTEYYKTHKQQVEAFLSLLAEEKEWITR